MPRLPRKVHLSARRAVRLDAPRAPGAPRARAPGEALYAEVEALVLSGDVAVTDAATGAPLDLGALPLAEFHTLRAILTHGGWLAEEAVAIDCRNCEAPFEVSPCAALPLGPFADGELHDPELDETLDLTGAHAIPPVLVAAGRTAAVIRLAPRTRAEAMPLHRALRRRRYRIGPAFVRGMGVVALGDELDPGIVARALERASPAAWGAVCQLFLAAHYPPRLGGIAACPACGARNDVDAPMDRELEPAPVDDGAAASFPDDAAFAAVGEALARDVLAGEDVTFVVDAGVPACDDGGEPLLGSYVPAWEGDAGSPSRAAEITVYTRTFRAAAREEPGFDWETELAETLAHELEHHHHALRGHDPKDDEERAEIRREAVRVHGARALAREATRALFLDLGTFLRRTWPLWLLVALLTALATAGER